MNFWRGVVKSTGQCKQGLRTQNHSKNIVTTEVPRDSHHLRPKREGFQPGEKAPFAYNDTYAYPKEFKPWSFNYRGDGVTIGLFLALCFSLAAYERSHATLTGRFERKYVEHKHHI